MIAYAPGMEILSVTALSVTAARAKWFTLVHDVVENNTPVTIIRGNKAAVLISMTEWQKLQQAATQAPQQAAGTSDLARVVVTLPTGETQLHGPYGTLDQAGRMGHSIARRKVRTAGADQEHPVTYRLQTQSGPNWMWLDQTIDRSWEQYWIPATRETTDARRCQNCGHDIVRFDGSWAVTSDDELVDGYSSCPPGAPLKESGVHKPARAKSAPAA